MNPKLMGYVRLMRPANLPTAAADILAGAAIAFWNNSVSLTTAHFPVSTVLYLVLSSVLLYAGGVVMNDVFDIKTDIKERPERPIPSGTVRLKSARIFGIILLLVGVLIAFTITQLSGFIAILLLFMILLYDGVLKENALLGPFSMGLCRSLNLLLGISVLGNLSYWPIALVPLVYIFAVTMISQGEVHGSNKRSIFFAGVLYAAVIFIVVYSAITNNIRNLEGIPIILGFVLMIFLPLVRAYQNNTPENIKKAVKYGVISIVFLDAALAVIVAPLWYALLILILLPISLILSRLFAVT